MSRAFSRRWISKAGRAVLLLALLPLVPSRAEDPESFDLGFLASRHRDVNGDLRLKVLGPLYERVSSTNGMRMDAFRPLYSTAEDPATDRALADYAWPVGTTRSVRDERRWRWLIFYGFNHTTNDVVHRYRTWLIPFYFQGRNASGTTYRALFPLGGTLRDFAGRDEISFALFPLYSTSALNDITTVNYLWPLISRTRSEKGHISRHRFFPFYGMNHHQGKFRKRFVLWPFYNDVRYEYGEGRGGGHMLFPLYGTVNLDTEKTLWVLPPFFRFTRGEQNIVHAPWPFFQKRSGENIDQLYLWPLWGRKKLETVDRSFFLWPVFWKEHVDRLDSTVDRFLVAPLFSHTAVRADADPESDERPEVLARKHKLWPLYSYRREGEASRLRFVELWPFADAPAVERNWAPLWTLYSRATAAGKADTEILWGLYRHHRDGEAYRYVSLFPLADYRRDARADAEGRSWNLLKGLVGYERKGSQKSIRLLYFLRFNISGEQQP